MTVLFFLMILMGLWWAIGYVVGRCLHSLLRLDAKWRKLVIWVVVLFPIIHEASGYVQFAITCRTHTSVWLSPEWDQVKAAREESGPQEMVTPLIFPIYKTHTEFIDKSTNRPFLKATRVYTRGSFWFNVADFRDSTICRHRDQREIFDMVRLEQLLHQGENK
jgi:hypothetical protein